MNTFESSLLTELREHVATRASTEPRRSTRVRRLRWSVLPVGAAAATAVALVLVQSPATAYAVSKTDDGSVVVTIDKLSDAAGLQKALQADGINAVVNYDAGAVLSLPTPRPGGSGPESGSSSGPQLTTGTGPAKSVSGGSVSDPTAHSCGSPGPVQVAMSPSSVTFTISAPEVDSSATLHITTAGSQGSGLSAIHIQWVC